MKPWGLNVHKSHKVISGESKLSVLDHNLPTYLQEVSWKSGIIIKDPLVSSMFNYTKAACHQLLYEELLLYTRMVEWTRSYFSPGKKSIQAFPNRILFASKHEASLNLQIVQITAVCFRWIYCLGALLPKSFLSKSAGLWCKIFT